MNYQGFLDFIKNVVGGFLTAGEWLNTPITIGDYFSFTPIMLLSIGGLTAFLTVAIIKWVAS